MDEVGFDSAEVGTSKLEIAQQERLLVAGPAGHVCALPARKIA